MKRICFYGGPGSGKSTTAARLFADLKQDGLNVEHVGEYVKSWAYTGRKVKSFDQVYLFAKQLNREDTLLSNGVDTIITDSPLLLCCVYTRLYTPNVYQELKGLTSEIEKKYPALHIFLDRGDKPYKKIGRYESYEQAKELDQEILAELCLAGIKPEVVPFSAYPEIRELVRFHCGEGFV